MTMNIRSRNPPRKPIRLKKFVILNDAAFDRRSQAKTLAWRIDERRRHPIDHADIPVARSAFKKSQVRLCLMKPSMRAGLGRVLFPPKNFEFVIEFEQDFTEVPSVSLEA